MLNHDTSFLADASLDDGLHLLRHPPKTVVELPEDLPEHGLGEPATMATLAPLVLGQATRLDDPLAIAHMDPPTPWITWVMALWNAHLNQNVLHPATAPFAREAETLVIRWLAPYFAMEGGHFCSGSTLANLTALWAAREAVGVKKVVASAAAHLSVRKAAHILGLAFEAIAINHQGQLDANQLDNLDDACLVLTAGTTTTGAVDPLGLAHHASWTHVDAAWAGPLRLSPTHSPVLDGIEAANSVAFSGHKWLFQPKESALILFRNLDQANAAISFGGSYLTTPNIGVQGSRGAAAIPLLATLLAWGKTGMVERIDRTMAIAHQLAHYLAHSKTMELWATPTTGITIFRPRTEPTADLLPRLPVGMLSTCMLDNELWFRSVSANPMADIEAIWAAIQTATSD